MLLAIGIDPLADVRPAVRVALESLALQRSQPADDVLNADYIIGVVVVMGITIGLVTLRSWRAANENPADVVKSE